MPPFFHDALVQSIEAASNAFMITPAGAVSVLPQGSDAMPLALSHACEQDDVVAALELARSVAKVAKDTLRYRFVQPLPLQAGLGGSVLSPGLLPSEVRAFEAALRLSELPIWIEYVVDGYAKGVLFWMQDDEFRSLEAFAGKTMIVLMPYVTKIDSAKMERSILDPVGAYDRYSQAEAAEQMITEKRAIDEMMGRDVDTAIFLASTLGYDSTTTTGIGMSSYFDVVVGRDPEIMALRREKGLRTW